MPVCASVYISIRGITVSLEQLKRILNTFTVLRALEILYKCRALGFKAMEEGPLEV